jgi:hypothetical protein
MTGREDPKTPDSFAVLDVAEDADDETIKRRYLALVRQHPPEREPERFGEIRAAFEAVESKRDRLRARLLTIHDAALLRLKRAICWRRTAHPGGRGSPRCGHCCATGPTGSGRSPFCPMRKAEKMDRMETGKGKIGT